MTYGFLQNKGLDGKKFQLKLKEAKILRRITTYVGFKQQLAKANTHGERFFIMTVGDYAC